MKSHQPGFITLVDDAKTHVQEISCHDLKTKMDNEEQFILIDVREDNEWDKGHLPNAIHISKGVIERDIETAVSDKSACLVLYCGGGYRSALAADNIQKMGYQNVFSLAGGYREWFEKGYAVE